MAAVNTNITFAPVARKASFVATLIATFKAWNDARATRNTLNTLTDRELADIGLCRGDIEYVATHTFKA